VEHTRADDLKAPLEILGDLADSWIYELLAPVVRMPVEDRVPDLPGLFGPLIIREGRMHHVFLSFGLT